MAKMDMLLNHANPKVRENAPSIISKRLDPGNPESKEIEVDGEMIVLKIA